MKNNSILVIGSSNTDMVIRSERIPAPGETILGGEFLMNQGGKGANQAVAAARLDGNVIFITKVGSDIFGQQALSHYKKEGIDLRFAHTDHENPSGTALIMVDAKGENCIAVAPGANAKLSPADLDSAKEAFAQSCLVLMQMETPIETIQHACAIAKKQGIRIVLNPAPAARIPSDVLSSLYLITPNQTEAELLTGIKVDDLDGAKKAATRLQEMGVETVLITMGSKGAFVQTAQGEDFIAAEKVKAVDTTAAGDTFNGALCVAISEGKDLISATKFANKAAALSVTRMGAQASAPYRKELDQ